MVVYVEYALIENFAVDFTLLYLTDKLIKGKGVLWRILLAAFLGGVFAVVFPVLRLKTPVSQTVKILCPFLLCAVAFLKKRGGQGSVQGKKGVYRYLFSVLAFFLLSFAYAGGLIAFFYITKEPYYVGDGGYLISKIPVGVAVFGLLVFLLLLKAFFKWVYQRKLAVKHIYPCMITVGEKAEKTDCFVDSGNLVKVNGVPVCFVSALIFYALRLQVKEENACKITVQTVNGERQINAYPADEMVIYLDGHENRIEKVYFALSKQLIGREYEILVGSWATEN